MASVRATQLRIVYSLLKPALRAAARFNVPMRSLAELVRLAYLELLAHAGLSQKEIAFRLGQTPRHMRSLARRLKTDFFSAEKEIGLPRLVEERIAAGSATEEELQRRLPSAAPDDLAASVATLLSDGRIERGKDGRLRPSSRYVVLSSAQFAHRIDALNHFLDGVFRAVLERLILDNQTSAMIKTVT